MWTSNLTKGSEHSFSLNVVWGGSILKYMNTYTGIYIFHLYKWKCLRFYIDQLYLRISDKKLIFGLHDKCLKLQVPTCLKCKWLQGSYFLISCLSLNCFLQSLYKVFDSFVQFCTVNASFGQRWTVQTVFARLLTVVHVAAQFHTVALVWAVVLSFVSFLSSYLFAGVAGSRSIGSWSEKRHSMVILEVKNFNKHNLFIKEYYSLDVEESIPNL